MRHRRPGARLVHPNRLSVGHPGGPPAAVAARAAATTTAAAASVLLPTAAAATVARVRVVVGLLQRIEAARPAALLAAAPSGPAAALAATAGTKAGRPVVVSTPVWVAAAKG